MSHPPKLAKFLVRLFASPERNDAYLGDIEELFAERAAALATVGIQTLRAARANPVKALKYE